MLFFRTVREFLRISGSHTRHECMRRQLRIESLERRALLTTFLWNTTVGDWDDAGSWKVAGSQTEPVEPGYDLPLGGTGDPYYPTKDGLWDIAKLNASGATVNAGVGTSAGRMIVSANTTLNLNGHSNLTFQDPQVAIPDLAVEDATDPVLTITNDETTSATLTAPFIRLGGISDVNAAGELHVERGTVQGAITVNATDVEVGYKGPGSLLVHDQATMNIAGTPGTVALTVGSPHGGAGTVTVSGISSTVRSTLNVTGDTLVESDPAFGGGLKVQDGGQATLASVEVSRARAAGIEVVNGGYLQVSDATVGVTEIREGNEQLAKATVLVKDQNSQLKVNGSLNLGYRSFTRIEATEANQIAIDAAEDITNEGTFTFASSATIDVTDNAVPRNLSTTV